MRKGFEVVPFPCRILLLSKTLSFMLLPILTFIEGDAA